MGLPRRTLLRAAAGAGASGVLAGCGDASVLGGFALRPTRPAGDEDLVVTLWSASAERRAFAALAEGFRAETGTRVVLQTVPFSRRGTTVDTGLRAGSPTDVFRVTYNDIGFYRAAGVLAELPDGEALRPAFAPAFWNAVSDADGVFGVPHHTDTSMVLVNSDAARAAGLGPLPADPEQAWGADRFLDAARRMRGGRGHPFAVNWQTDGAYRWLNWVDQAGGRLLTPSLDRAVSPDDSGLRTALELTRGFFREGLVPPSSSAGGTVTTDELFSGQSVAMAFAANFLVPDLEAVPFGWEAMPLPRGERASADPGGNALVATEGPRREQALAFLRYCVEREQMAAFCVAASALPTRVDLPPGAVAYRSAPAVMERYRAQAATVRTEVVDQVTVPAAGAMITELADGLEQAFLGDAPLEEAAVELTGAVDRAVRR